eukprot:2552291-Ditylum_brightwellii.AAC.1
MATCASSLSNNSTAVKKESTKLLPKTKLVICNAASLDGRASQPDLPIYLQYFLNQTTTANTLEHLRDQLFQHSCICGIAPGASIAIHMGHFTWTTPDIPTNFT